jgi:putative lipoprotein
LTAASKRRAAALVLALMLIAGTSPARAQDADPWFGRDKALHFTATASIALAGYGGTALATDDRRLRGGVGVAVALAAGAGKEVWDAAGHGDPSARDLVWDVVGTATGVLLAWTIDWLIHR